MSLPEIENFKKNIIVSLFTDVILKSETIFKSSDDNKTITLNAGESVYVIQKTYPDKRIYYFAIYFISSSIYVNVKMRTRYGVLYNDRGNITKEEINSIIKI